SWSSAFLRILNGFTHYLRIQAEKLVNVGNKVGEVRTEGKEFQTFDVSIVEHLFTGVRNKSVVGKHEEDTIPVVRLMLLQSHIESRLAKFNGCAKEFYLPTLRTRTEDLGADFVTCLGCLRCLSLGI